MSDNSELLKHFEVTSQRVRHHHNALWEEEKHYSWWVYIIFAGLILVYTNQHLCWWHQLAIIIGGSLLGLYLSYSGYRIIRREGIFFSRELEIYKRAQISCNLQRNMPSPNEKHPLLPKMEVKDWRAVESAANKSWRELVRPPFRNLRIRDFFQLNFIITGVLFIAMVIFSAVTLPQ